MSERIGDRLRIARVIGLTAGVTLLGVIALFAVVVVVSVTATAFALSDGFFWASAAAVVIMQLLCGVVAGRLAAPRLGRAGMAEGWRSHAIAAAGPVAVALLTNARPVEGISPVPGVVVPIAAAAVGTVVGVRTVARRRRSESFAGY
ncbi:hypothetical protein [Actinomadura alba]|uniref:Uncharacterized protein n=1 Tax=Actinomadura alba TaxID=406431 RepID=A0ABR7LQG8_9ACTN|nr:hypothetical protein [Actinomadura alba]MBC6467061.1 hypothetical protein [Actinomadura alba]